MTAPIDPRQFFKPNPQTGVLKALDHEAFTLRIATIGFILRSAIDLLGAGALAVLREAGRKAGAGTYAIIAKQQPSTNQELLFLLIEGDALAGWGRYRFEHLDHERKEATIVVENSFVADAIGSYPQPVCTFLAGYFEGFFSALWQCSVTCEEEVCKATGAPHCRFRLSS